MARGLVATLCWWGVVKEESPVGRFTRPDPEAMTFLAVPMLDYTARVMAAVRRAQDALGQW